VSVKRKSTNLTSLSFTMFMTSATVLAISSSCVAVVGKEFDALTEQNVCHRASDGAEICTNPVHTGIIADRAGPTRPIFRTLTGQSSPFWCKNSGFGVHYFGAQNHCAPKWR
jgi:hypothetical protein